MSRPIIALLEERNALFNRDPELVAQKDIVDADAKLRQEFIELFEQSIDLEEKEERERSEEEEKRSGKEKKKPAAVAAPVVLDHQLTQEVKEFVRKMLANIPREEMDKFQSSVTAVNAENIARRYIIEGYVDKYLDWKPSKHEQLVKLGESLPEKSSAAPSYQVPDASSSQWTDLQGELDLVLSEGFKELEIEKQKRDQAAAKIQATQRMIGSKRDFRKYQAEQDAKRLEQETAETARLATLNLTELLAERKKLYDEGEQELKDNVMLTGNPDGGRLKNLDSAARRRVLMAERSSINRTPTQEARILKVVDVDALLEKRFTDLASNNLLGNVPEATVLPAELEKIKNLMDVPGSGNSFRNKVRNLLVDDKLDVDVDQIVDKPNLQKAIIEQSVHLAWGWTDKKHEQLVALAASLEALPTQLSQPRSTPRPENDVLTEYVRRVIGAEDGSLLDNAASAAIQKRFRGNLRRKIIAQDPNKAKEDPEKYSDPESVMYYNPKYEGHNSRVAEAGQRELKKKALADAAKLLAAGGAQPEDQVLNIDEQGLDGQGLSKSSLNPAPIKGSAAGRAEDVEVDVEVDVDPKNVSPLPNPAAPAQTPIRQSIRQFDNSPLLPEITGQSQNLDDGEEVDSAGNKIEPFKMVGGVPTFQYIGNKGLDLLRTQIRNATTKLKKGWTEEGDSFKAASLGGSKHESLVSFARVSKVRKEDGNVEDVFYEITAVKGIVVSQEISKPTYDKMMEAFEGNFKAEILKWKEPAQWQDIENNSYQNIYTPEFTDEINNHLRAIQEAAQHDIYLYPLSDLDFERKRQDIDTTSLQNATLRSDAIASLSNFEPSEGEDDIARAAKVFHKQQSINKILDIVQKDCELTNQISDNAFAGTLQHYQDAARSAVTDAAKFRYAANAYVYAAKCNIVKDQSLIDEVDDFVQKEFEAVRNFEDQRGKIAKKRDDLKEKIIKKSGFPAGDPRIANLVAADPEHANLTAEYDGLLPGYEKASIALLEKASEAFSKTLEIEKDRNPSKQQRLDAANSKKEESEILLRGMKFLEDPANAATPAHKKEVFDRLAPFLKDHDPKFHAKLQEKKDDAVRVTLSGIAIDIEALTKGHPKEVFEAEKKARAASFGKKKDDIEQARKDTVKTDLSKSEKKQLRKDCKKAIEDEWFPGDKGARNAMVMDCVDEPLPHILHDGSAESKSANGRIASVIFQGNVTNNIRHVHVHGTRNIYKNATVCISPGQLIITYKAGKAVEPPVIGEVGKIYFDEDTIHHFDKKTGEFTPYSTVPAIIGKSDLEKLLGHRYKSDMQLCDKMSIKAVSALTNCERHVTIAAAGVIIQSDLGTRQEIEITKADLQFDQYRKVPAVDGVDASVLYRRLDKTEKHGFKVSEELFYRDADGEDQPIKNAQELKLVPGLTNKTSLEVKEIFERSKQTKYAVSQDESGNSYILSPGESFVIDGKGVVRKDPGASPAPVTAMIITDVRTREDVLKPKPAILSR